jgi:hypothetical protein
MPSPLPDRYVLHFPRDDEAFSRYVDAALTIVTGPDELQARLRTLYPDASVKVQSVIGSPGPATPWWHVYRDGMIRAAADTA